jgi:hypothetical protein
MTPSGPHAVTVIDAAGLSETMLEWLDGHLACRRKEGRSTLIAGSLAQALEHAEQLPARARLTLVARCGPAEPRKAHALFGQREGLGDAERLGAMIDEGTVELAAWLPFTSQLQSAIQHASTQAAMLVLTACATSERLERWLQMANADVAMAWICRDAIQALRRGGRTVEMRCRHLAATPGKGAARMFHTGPQPLGPSGPFKPHTPLWVSPSPAFAACFALPSVREGHALHGLDVLAPRPRVTVSADAERLAMELSNSHTVLHTLRVPAHAVEPAGTCTRLEYQLRSSAQLVEVQTSPVRELLDSLQVCLETPDERFVGSLAGFDIHADRWRATIGADRATAERFKSLRRAARAWLPDAAMCPPSTVPGFDASVVLRLLRRALLPEIAEAVCFPTGGHGERHAWLISHLALLLALEQDLPPVACAVAGALHDAGRHGDEDDAEHPARGTAIARSVVPNLRMASLPARACEAVATAIGAHSDDTPTACPIGAVLRDADRLGLAWERGYDARFFATDAGHRLARAGPEAAEAEFRRRFGACLFDTVGFSGAP